MQSVRKKSLQEVADIVEIEGLGYAVQSYLSADSIKDPEVSRLWHQAKTALDAIAARLQKVSG